MKKQFMLFAIATTLMCACALSLKSKPANVIYAEGEETSEPEPISSEEPALSSFEEEEPSSEPAVVEEPKESVVKKIETFRDTFLVPLLSGISVTTIVSLVISVALAMKNRNTNKEMAAENKNTQALALSVISKSTELLEKALEIFEKVDKQLEEQVRIQEAFASYCNAKVQNLVDEVNALKEEMRPLFDMKECMLLLADIQTEMAKADPQVVSTGVVEKIAQLNSRVKEMQGE